MSDVIKTGGMMREPRCFHPAHWHGPDGVPVAECRVVNGSARPAAPDAERDRRRSLYAALQRRRLVARFDKFLSDMIAAADADDGGLDDAYRAGWDACSAEIKGVDESWCDCSRRELHVVGSAGCLALDLVAGLDQVPDPSTGVPLVPVETAICPNCDDRIIVGVAHGCPRLQHNRNYGVAHREPSHQDPSWSDHHCTGIPEDGRSAKCGGVVPHTEHVWHREDTDDTPFGYCGNRVEHGAHGWSDYGVPKQCEGLAAGIDHTGHDHPDTSDAVAACELAPGPGEPWCECDWLGFGTPRHRPTPTCIDLRPDGPRGAAGSWRP